MLLAGEAHVKPLLLSAYTATSCIGRGLGPTLADAARGTHRDSRPCAFETVALDTYVGEVPRCR